MKPLVPGPVSSQCVWLNTPPFLSLIEEGRAFSSAEGSNARERDGGGGGEPTGARLVREETTFSARVRAGDRSGPSRPLHNSRTCAICEGKEAPQSDHRSKEKEERYCANTTRKRGTALEKNKCAP